MLAAGTSRVNRPFQFATVDNERAWLSAYGEFSGDLKPMDYQLFNTYVQAGWIVKSDEDPSAPVNDVDPSITGTAQVGETLTGDPGEWSGSAPIEFTYAWEADGAAISGATGLTYVPVVGDVGKEITFVVTAANGIGSISAESDPTSEVIPV